MKKHLNLAAAGRLVLLIEIALFTVALLCAVMVNGTDIFTTDYLWLLFLLIIIIVSAVLVKAPTIFHRKAVLWISVLPLLFISYQTVALFVLPYHS